MILLLRVIGVMNAAVWLGAAIFFTFAVAPTFFTPEMKKMFGEAYAGLIAQKVLERYFALQYWCGAIAIVHQLAEWVYLGRALHRLTLGLLLGLFCVGLLGGLLLQPKLKRWHEIKYSTELYRREVFSAARREQAARAFRIWHGVSQGVNLLALCGLAVYSWRVLNPDDTPRFLSTNKFRG